MRKAESKILDPEFHCNTDEPRACPQCMTQGAIQVVAGGWYVCDSCRNGFRSFEKVANQVVEVRTECLSSPENLVIEERQIELFSFLSLFFLVISCLLFYLIFNSIFYPYTTDPSEARNFGLMLLPVVAWSTLCWLSSARLISMLFTDAFLLGILALLFISIVFFIIRGIFFSDGVLYFFAFVILVIWSLVAIVYFIGREFYRDRIRMGEDEQEVTEDFRGIMADAFMARSSSWFHHYQLQRKIIKKIGARKS